MGYRLLADLLVVVHLGFVGFVVFGGALVWRWPRLALLHLPAVLWAVAIEWTGGMCPLTPAENWLRARAGETPYGVDFVAQYLLPFLYPAELTRGLQVWLGSGVLVLNVGAYALLWSRRRKDPV